MAFLKALVELRSGFEAFNKKPFLRQTFYQGLLKKFTIKILTTAIKYFFVFTFGKNSSVITYNGNQILPMARRSSKS